MRTVNTSEPFVVDPRYASEALLVASASGDEDAFALLVERIRPQALRVARGVVRDPSIAEEVAQEVLTEIWLRRTASTPSGAR